MKITDRIASAFGSLSAREQRLLGVLGGILVLFIGFLFWYFVGQKLSAMEEELERISSLTTEIETNKEGLVEKFAGVAQKTNRDPVTRLTSFLEDISKRKDVPVKNYGGEKSVPTKDKRYVETQLEVRLSRVTLQQAIGFLEEIESAEEAAYTKQLEISIPRKTERDSLEVVVTVATYEDPKAEKKAKEPKERENKVAEESKREIDSNNVREVKSRTSTVVAPSLSKEEARAAEREKTETYQSAKSSAENADIAPGSRRTFPKTVRPVLNPVGDKAGYRGQIGKRIPTTTPPENSDTKDAEE